MASIGDRLEEARKRQGISIRDAAEATKIRGDFLLSFENNKFDIDLPEVYRRGFLKNYARYLKLDPERIAADYQALVTAQQKGVRRADATRETYGRMEVSESHPTLGSRESEPPGERQRRAEGGPADPVQSGRSDSGLFPKLALAGGAFVLVAGLVVLGVVLLAPNSSNTSPDDSPEPAAVAEGPVELILRARGDISRVFIRRMSDRELLWSGSLGTGESISVEISETVEIRCSSTERLTVAIDEQSWELEGSGAGRVLFDPSGPSS